MKLSKLFENAPEVEISGLSIDSRKVGHGDIYFCMPGMTHDGHDFIEDVIKKNVSCIVYSKELEHKYPEVVYIKVKNVNKTLNRIAALFYDNPSKKLKVFGVTGTNGKSTVTSIIEDVYSKFEPCGYIGTIAIRYGSVKLPPSLTTPDAISIHRTLKDMVDCKVRAVALEVSSHGLELGRVESVDFDIAVFTNLTYDHLDFHGTFNKYFAAKRKLFEQLKKEGVAILNADDPTCDDLREACRARVVTYGIHHDANYRVSNIVIGTKGTSFSLHYQGKVYDLKTNLVALYNIYNLLSAIAAICESGIEIEKVITHIANLKQIEGRMERIDEGQLFNVIVDFAHTPDGLEKVFEYAKCITPDDHHIIAVFGSAGKRDAKKRKVFGEIADRYCSSIILTEDDPRDESARQIAIEIKSGIKHTQNIFIEDRYMAIRQAIESANVHDTVLVLGKGDETFMYREFGKEPWFGDHKVASVCIRKYCLKNGE